MVAKLETIRKKIKQGKKLGFSERARAVNKGLLPSKAKKKKKSTKRKKTKSTKRKKRKSLKKLKRRYIFKFSSYTNF